MATGLHLTLLILLPVTVLSQVVLTTGRLPTVDVSEQTDQCKENSTVLYILALGPFPDPGADPGPGWDAAPAFIPAARLAVEQINNRSDILADYQLGLLEGDSGCNLEDRAYLSFVSELFYPCQDKTVVGIVGPGCSAAALALAPLTVREELNILQMSIATTPLISGTKPEHSNTYRTVPSSFKYIDAFEEIIVERKWNRVAALYDNLREFHIATHNEFRDRVREGSLGEFYSSGIEEQLLSGALNGLDSSRTRIVFVFAGQGLARNVLCSAYHRNLLFPTYQWFFTDRVLKDFVMDVKSFRLGSDVINCTSAQMSIALNGTILSVNQFKRQDLETNDTAAQLSYWEYERLYNETLKEYLQELNLNRSGFARNAFNFNNAYYDATWALALSLNDSVEELGRRGYNLWEHYRHNQPTTKEVGDVVRTKLEELRFEGMSGTIMFDEKRHEVSSIDIDLHQVWYDDNKRKAVPIKAGVFEPLNISKDTILIDDDFDAVVIKIPLGLGVFFIIVDVVLTAVAISLQIAIVYYSDRKSVKASSPHLNHLIFSGCYLCVLASVVFTLQAVFVESYATNPVLYGVSCSMIFWTTSFSFSLVFGIVCGKTWRIYRIFTHFSQNKVRFVSDRYLFTFVVVLLTLDTIIMCAWNLVNPWRLERRIDVSDEQKLLTWNTCLCDNLIVWAGVILGIKGMIAAIAVYLSIVTRQVHRKEYKTTQNISIFIYSLIFTYGFGIPVVIFTNSAIPILSFIVVNLMLILTVVLTCVCIILPPLWPVENFYGSKVLSKSRTLKRDLTLTLSNTTHAAMNSPVLRSRRAFGSVSDSPDSRTRSVSFSSFVTSPS